MIYAHQRIICDVSIVLSRYWVTDIEDTLMVEQVEQSFIAKNCLRLIVSSVNMDVIIRPVLIYGK